MIEILYCFLFILIFSVAQGVVYLIHGTTPAKEAKKTLGKIRKSSVVTRFLSEKQIALKRMRASVLLKDQITVSEWYMYKFLMAAALGMIAFFVICGILDLAVGKLLTAVAAVLGWMLLDLTLRLQNKSSNDEMMPDIMEMSRSVLYGKRGGQYIADALKDAVIVVENKRLKTALMKLRNELDAGKSLDVCLDDLEMSFSNGEISSFCTVIKSLQSTG